MAEWTPRRTVDHDAIDDGQRLVVQRHHALGVQFAERDLEPGALTGYLVHTIKLQIDELTDAQARGSHEEQRVGPQPVGPAFELAHQATIGIRWDIAG